MCFAELTDLRTVNILECNVASLRFLKNLIDLRELNVAFPGEDDSMIINNKELLLNELNFIGDLPHLRSLYVEEWTLTQESHSSVCDTLLEGLSHLEDHLEELYLPKMILSQDGISHLQKLSSTSLRQLEICGVEFAYDNFWVDLVFSLGNLEDLRLMWCDEIFDLDIKEGVNKDDIRERFPNKLKRLVIETCSEIEEQFFDLFVSQLENLQELEIRDCTFSFTTGYFKYLVSLHNLKTLNCLVVEDWHKEKCFFAEALFTELEVLTLFRTADSGIVGFCDEDLLLLATKFPFLRRLSAWTARIISEEGLSSPVTVTGLVTSLLKMKNLEYLDMQVPGLSYQERKSIEKVLGTSVEIEFSPY